MREESTQAHHDPYGLSGTTLGDGQFVLEDFLDDNGIILTYSALQPRLNRRVNIQTLRPSLRGDEAMRHGLARGAQLIASYEHANIVPVIDFGQSDDGIPYIAIRSMRGGLLQSRLMRESIALGDAASIVRQIGSALEYIHARGQVHGDPCPDNIGFDEAGGAYITDFILLGIYTESGFGENIAGTILYMAPERLRNQLPTPFSDQYALAVVAYRLITGTFPSGSNILSDSIEFHFHGTMLPPQNYRAEVPPGVNDVLLRAMAKHPDDRYPTVLDFAREFERAITAAPQHLFISYSRRDADYARALREHLTQNGFTVWIDAEIEHGDQWFNQIHDAIKTSAAFIAVMTPNAEKSEWVQKEILLAKRYQKPIFPLLHDGMEFAILIDIQFADVRDGSLPGQDFHRRLSRAIYGTA